MNHRLYGLPLLVFALIVATGALFIGVQDRYWHLQQQKSLDEAAFNQATLLEKHLLRSMSTAYTLATVLRAEGDIERFESLARDLLEGSGLSGTLALAPEGVIRRIYPLEGNRDALGHDILADDGRKSDAFVALATRRMTIAGPFELAQGGTGLIGRQPVFLPASTGHEDRFWGFASMLVRVEDLFESAELSRLQDRGYQYQIWRYQPDSGRRQTLFGNPAIAEHAATVPVSVQNLEWQLSLWPSSPHRHPLIWAHALVVVLVAALGASLIFFLVRQPYVLGRTVAQKTRLLEIANVQLRENEKHLLRQAHHDPLTGLPNRLLFGDRIRQALARAERDGHKVGLLLIDLDRFKPVNDRWGHAAGDQVLVQVSRRLSSCARRSDTVARFGGDEFILLLPSIGEAENAVAIADKVRETLRRWFTIPQGRVELGCSIGIALYPEHGTDADALISHADRAMYAAKQMGRGGHRGDVQAG